MFLPHSQVYLYVAIIIHLPSQSLQPDTIQIANYYDLYNSLIVWSTRKWGCSGEHITGNRPLVCVCVCDHNWYRSSLCNVFILGMYIENEDGKLVPLKADHDVLNLKESQVVVVEIKD